MSGKSSYKEEKRQFDQIFKAGSIALLHDLTSVLRLRDLTIVTEEGYMPIEVKTSLIKNQRTKRQQENSDKLYANLENDQTEGLFGVEKMFRVEMISQEKHHIRHLNTIIKESAINGHATKVIEKGLIYAAAHEENDGMNEIFEIMKNKKFLKPFVCTLNMRKFSERGYFPFSLSIEDPVEYLNFLEGRLILFVVVEYAEIESYALKYGYKATMSTSEDYVFDFRAMTAIGIDGFSVSSHYLDRISMEFNSLKWTCKEMFERMNSWTEDQLTLENYHSQKT